MKPYREIRESDLPRLLDFKTEDFKPGDTVEYCGEQAVVVTNWGSSGTVEIPGQGRMSWYWVFDGEPVRLVRRAECTA